MTQFETLISQSIWIKHKEIFPGDNNSSAMDSLSLCNLFKILESVYPKNILEFGLGESSKLIHQYAKYYEVTALTVESNSEWLSQCRRQSPNIDFNVTLIDTEQQPYQCALINVYKKKGVLPLTEQKWDFIIIDGSCAYDNPPLARIQRLVFTKSLMEDWCIFIHDSERRGERAMMKRLRDKLEKNGVAFCEKEYVSIKNHTVFCSKSWESLSLL